MMRRNMLLVLIANVIVLGLNAESKVEIRYIKSTEIAKKTAQGKELQNKLMAENKRYNDKREKLGKDLQDEEKKLQEAAQAYGAKRSTLSEAARGTEEKKLTLMQQQLNTKAQSAQNELQQIAQAVEELKQKYFEEIKKSAERLAKAENIDAIHDEETGMVLYVSNKGDVTDKLIADLNKEHAVKLAANGNKTEKKA